MRAALTPPPPPTTLSKIDLVMRLASSGLFFMFAGALILILAFSTMGSSYAIFSFVLVVVGVAVLLFGTGTQSMGEFGSESAAAKYKVSLAGGAGALAFAIAYGIVNYAPEMKTAFQIERKYILALVKPALGDGNSNFSDHAPFFTIDGLSIPVMRRGDYIIAYIPYVGNEKASPRTVEFEFKGVTPGVRNKVLESTVKGTFTVDIAKAEHTDGGFDFPIYRDIKPIDMRSPQNAQDIIDNAKKNSPGAEPSVPPPALPPAGGA